MEELPEDLLSIIFNYFSLEDMIIMRRLGNNFNNILVSNIRTKLKILSRFNTDLLDVDLLMNLCKIYIIKSNVFAGQDRSFITTDGRTFCTTMNQVFEFGNNIKTPVLLKDFYDVKYVSIHDLHFCTISWSNIMDRYFAFYDRIHEISNISIHNITQLDMTETTILMLDTEGQVYYIGYCTNNKLLNDQIPFDPSVTILDLLQKTKPSRIEGLPKIKQIAICRDYGLCLTKDNSIYGFSHRNERETVFNNKEPTLVNHNVKEPINSIILDDRFVILITDNFNMYVSKHNIFKFAKCELMNIIQHASGSEDTLLLLSLTGQVYVSGTNKYGQLGLGQTNIQYEWTIIPNLNNVIKIAAGNYHSLFLTADEKVYACGRNDKGQLGLGHTNNVDIPTLVMDLRQ